MATKLKTKACDGCQAKIFWVKQPSGKLHPVNTGKKIVYIETPRGWLAHSGYESHFLSCPAADMFKGRNVR